VPGLFGPKKEEVAKDRIKYGRKKPDRTDYLVLFELLPQMKECKNL
jgi:hypothetical protein